ncbi:HTH-like domain-containing protein [Domibacillus robiginosus]|uniref:HTH-like domain-containing protein n=1 Tax=Domibacillus robiginosus TaxID=1071054 RepID=UPI003CCB9350
MHFFGIKYRNIILRNKYSAAEIVKVSGIEESYKTGVRKSINLSNRPSYQHFN